MFTLAPSPLNGQVIWAGSDDGLVHVTRDGGGQWTKVTPPDLPDFTRISMIEASPHDAGTAYLAGNRYQQGDRGPYVYRTRDYGATWTKIVTGIPADDFAAHRSAKTSSAKACCSSAPKPASTSASTTARGGSRFGSRLPVTPVHGIEVKGDDLVIATHGRSFYVLDNIGLLRQVSRETTNEPVVLFDPSDAIRSVSRGVTVDYYLKQPADKVTIEFLDAQGRTIRSSLACPRSRRRLRRPRHRPMMTTTSPARLRRLASRFKQGMNRFTWDMRFPDAPDFPGLIMWAGSVRGPLAPPGTYTVTITASGVTKTAAVRVEAERGSIRPHRRGSSGAVRARQTDQRPCRRRQRGCRPNPQPEDANRGSDRQVVEPCDQERGNVPFGEADGGRRGDLSASKPQQPGSAQLSHSPRTTSLRRCRTSSKVATLGQPTSPAPCSRSCQAAWTKSYRSSTRS